MAVSTTRRDIHFGGSNQNWVASPCHGGCLLSRPKRTFFLWPQGTVVSIQTEGGFWQPLGKFSCPPLVEPDALCLRMEEVLWDAVDSGGEFVELLNCGEVPLELGGLSATTKAWPLPSEWQTWIDPAYSVVLLPDSVLAFGECTKWFTAGFPESGPALWRAEAWSALNDEAGDLAIRLPGRSMDADRVQWSPDFIGPWWWSPDGWSWQRQGQTDLGWSPSSSRGSPGRLERVTERLDACLGANGRTRHAGWTFSKRPWGSMAVPRGRPSDRSAHGGLARWGSETGSNSEAG